MTTHSTPKKPRSGTLEAYTDATGATRYRGRLRLGDGTKSGRFDLPGATEAEARAQLAALQAQEDREHMVLDAKRDRARELAAASKAPHDAETCDAWHERFLASRRLGNVDDSRGRWRRWIAPHIGALPMARVGQRDVECVRDALDAAIVRFQAEGRGGDRLMPKSALNVWSVLTTAFKHACASKDRSLRVLTENPCVGVLPPESGASRIRSFLYPSEIAAFLSCNAIPVRWRQLVALAVYCYPRPGELWELRFGDVHFESGLLNISRAWDWEGGAAKPPKTVNGVRDVPIPAALLPMLRAMANGQPPTALLFPELRALNENKVARKFREYLTMARVERSTLFLDSKTHMPVNFRSCRDTGITWLALAGVGLERMQRRAGHDDLDTTAGYMKQAEDLAGRLGEPFAALPAELLVSTAEPISVRAGPTFGPFSSQPSEIIVPEEGVEPPT